MSRIFTRILICLLVFATSMASAQELRSGVELAYEIKKFEFGGEVQYRYVNVEKSRADIIQFSSAYNIHKHLSIGAGYRYGFTSEFTDETEFSTETDEKRRVNLDLNLNTNRFENDLKLKFRSRYQNTFTSDNKTKSYFRQRILFDYELTGSVSPYVSAEAYYRIDNQELNTFRLSVGTEIEIGKTELELYYISENKIEDEMLHQSFMMGVSLKVPLSFK